MSSSHRALVLAGYVPEVVRALGPSSASRLSWIAASHALPCVLMGAGAGYAVQLAQGVPALSIAAGCVFGLFVLNLLRVSVAGGGMAPHKTNVQSARFRPAMPPVIVIALLSALIGQPALLPLFAAELDPQVEAHRAVLLRAHAAAPPPERVTAGSEAGRLRRLRGERYVKNVMSASFAAQRVTRMWQAPAAPALLTLGFVGACLLPLVLARLPLVSAVRHYELVRRERLQVLLLSMERRTAHAVHAELSRYPSYDAPPPPERPERASLTGGVA